MTPTPYARRTPNITLIQLDALIAAAARTEGKIHASAATSRVLVKRGWGQWRNVAGWTAQISAAGRQLLYYQGNALRQILLEKQNESAQRRAFKMECGK